MLSTSLDGWAGSAIMALPEGATTPVGAEEVRLGPKGISIQVRGRNLSEVLQHIQNQSGIRFEIPVTMMKLPLSAKVNARDWTEAVQRLLREFNRMESFDQDKTLQRVILLESSDPGNAPPVSAALIPAGKLAETSPAGMPRSMPMEPQSPQSQETAQGGSREQGVGSPRAEQGNASVGALPPGVTAADEPLADPPVGLGMSRDIGPPDLAALPYEPGPDVSRYQDDSDGPPQDAFRPHEPGPVRTD